ncbi:MAG: RraA family protein [Devosia sp.]|uniref:RraA family protein n=1 Tax=Devosia sp. TaxID=1871048 RepID=UPI001A6222BB|nr:RraA family protein [Devosia sp.]MBL8599980.1 RraA family protein [Devosia sp.]
MTRSDLLAACRNELYSAVVSDTLDALGYCNQAMAPGFTPLADETVLVGFARTGIYLPIYHDDDSVNVYEHEIELVDSLREDEVIVLSCADNLRITPWGELLSTRAKYLKAAGCITDGSVRDARLIRAMGFSVFSRGRNPVDTKHRGKMIWRDVPVDVGGVRINTGDFIIGDLDGVVVAPQAVADEAIAKALQKVRAESTVREELAAGQSLAAVFEKHRIL